MFPLLFVLHSCYSKCVDSFLCSALLFVLHSCYSNGDLHCKATDQDTLIPSLEALTVRNQEKGMYVEIETPEAIVSESSAVCKARSHAVYVPPYHGPSYPSAYIRVVEGWACRSDDKTVSELLQKYSLENPECPVVMEHWERKEGGRRGRNQARRKMESAGGERYEIATARHGDRAFLKFQKEVAKCSHQILRCVVLIIYIYLTYTFSVLCIYVII